MLLVAWVRSAGSRGCKVRLWGLLRLFPWMGSLLADYEAANFAELLALLLEHQVPYPSALVLAAESSGDPRLVRAARAVAELAQARGDRSATAIETVDRDAFLAHAALGPGDWAGPGSLVAALHDLAVHYRKRARFQAEKLSVFLPLILLIVIGASDDAVLRARPVRPADHDVARVGGFEAIATQG